MSWLRAIRHRAADADVDKELRFHIEQQIDDYVRGGMSRGDATRRTHLEFGGVEQVKEECRDVRRIQWFADAWRDVQYAIRTLIRNPSFASIAIVSLGLSIGASTAVFSIVNSVLLKPLPYPDSDRIVLLVNTSRAGGVFPEVSGPRFTVWRQYTDAFQDATAYVVGGSMKITIGDQPEQVGAGRVSAKFFHLFGASVALGRTFTKEEDRPSGPHVVVLSYGFWQRRFGATPGVVGQRVSLNSEPYVVIGVLSAAFNPRSASPVAGQNPDVWVPLQLDPNNQSDANNLFGAARLRSGVTLVEAQAQTQLAVSAFRRAFPGVMSTTSGLEVMPLQALVVGDVRPSLLLLFASVAVLLLIVCVNIACLLLVRASGRRRELAIRVAAGASYGRVVRQLLTESLVLAAAGSALGLFLGVVGTRTLLAIQPGNIPRIAQDGSDVTVDLRVLLFVLAVSTASAVTFGLLPALQTSRVDLDASLKSSGDRASSTIRGQKARALLVISEVALASVLLVGAGLLIRSFVALRHVDPGFDAHGVLTMQMPMADRRFATTLGTTQVLDNSTRLVGTLPGVDAVGATLTGVPLEGENSILKISIVGRALDDSVVGSWRIVSPSYFNVFKVPLIRGRLFTDHDDRNSPAVVIINQALARRFWPDRDPLHDRIVLGQGAGPDFEDVPREIIGVVGDIRQASLGRDPLPAAHVPLAQLPETEMAFLNRLGVSVTWLVRSHQEPYLIAGAVQGELRKASGEPVTRIRSMDDVSASSTAQTQFEMRLLAAFGVSALLLAAFGVYGVAAYSVRQRTREIGVRMALGATHFEVMRLVLGQSTVLVAIGIVLGVAGATALAHYMKGMLFGLTPLDPLTFIAVPIIFAFVATLAAYLPARRAARLDPTVTLRSE